MKLVIVGGVAGGATAAARARRLSEDAEIVVLERGKYVSFANCGLPYYLGGIIEKRDTLLIQTPEGLKQRFNIDIRTQNRVESIDRENKRVKVVDTIRDKEYWEDYDRLILSPGAEPFIPPFEGSRLSYVHRVRTIPDIDRIKSKIDSEEVKKAVVIGAGFIGLEMAENLREKGIETYLIEKTDQVMPVLDKDMAVILQREMVASDVILYLNEEVVRIKENNKSCVVETASGKNLDADIVIMAIGVKPEIKLAKDAGLDIGARGIVINDKMQTTDPDIFAIGDVVETKDFITGISRNVPLAGPAAKQALVAVNTIFGIEDSYEGVLGTSIVKVFSLTAAMTGETEKSLQTAGIPYQKVYTHPADHVGYYPGTTKMAIKLLYSPDTQIVLGAQVVGENDIARKTDVFSLAIKHKLTVKDLAEAEFCYAPPYGTSKDAVNLAGMVALNHLRGITRLIHWEDVSSREYFVLDVRTKEEHKEYKVPNSHNIPLDELRGQLASLPKDKPIAVFCHVGIRAHIACRILTQSGFKAVNISGGYLTFMNYRDAYKSGKMLAVRIKLFKDETFCSAPTGEIIGKK